MSQATDKYQGDQDERYDGKLQWPGSGGYPFLGEAAPSLKQHEVEGLPVSGRAKERVFDLNIEKDRKDYNWTRDRIRNGLFVRDNETRRWPDDAEWPTIYLEWTQLYVSIPRQTLNRSISHASATQFSLRRPD